MTTPKSNPLNHDDGGNVCSHFRHANRSLNLNPPNEGVREAS